MGLVRISSLALVTAVLAALLAPGTPQLATASAGDAMRGPVFEDIAGSVHAPMIRAVAAEGITVGCDGERRRYCPDDEVTRGQMATFLASAFGLPVADGADFDDVTGSTHEDGVNRIAAAGITSGTSDGGFAPRSTVSRGQMATFLALALDLPAAESAGFADVEGVHADNIDRVALAGITRGCDTGGTRFCPSDSVTRGQMATFLGQSLGLEPVPAPQPPTSGYVVAPHGDDAAAGTADEPWGTIAASLTRLEPGDTLWVRGGEYFERNVHLAGVEGTADAPITVQSYPGERPVVDGGYPEFRTVGNADWEVVDAARNVYRSARTYPATWVHGKFEHAGELHALAAYQSLASLMSDDIYYDQDPSYAGPGIYYNDDDARIYVRLEPLDPAATDGRRAAVPADPDPRRTPIFIGPTGSSAERHGLVNARGATRHLVVDGIDLAFHEWSVRFHDVTENVVFRNATWTPLKIGAVTGSRVDGLLLENLEIVLGFPEWLSWKEIKTGSSAGVLREQKLTGVAGQGGGSRNIEVRDTVFDRAFDAMVGFSGDRHIRVHHNHMVTYDDALQLRESASHVEFAYNRVDGPGISHYGPTTNAQPGTVWVHHNIIDARRPILWQRRESGGPVESEPLRVMPTHGSTDTGHPWKIYNNTLLGASPSASTGIETVGRNDTGVPHEVYNNIVVSQDRWVTRGMQVDRSDVYDGNAYWWRDPGRSAATLFFRVRDGDDRESFASLSEFRGSASWEATRDYYMPGWEASGIDDRDPRLDADHVPGDTIVWHGGVDLAGRGFPGVDGVYRGAVRPGDDGTSVGVRPGRGR